MDGLSKVCGCASSEPVQQHFDLRPGSLYQHFHCLYLLVCWPVLHLQPRNPGKQSGFTFPSSLSLSTARCCLVHHFSLREPHIWAQDSLKVPWASTFPFSLHNPRSFPPILTTTTWFPLSSSTGASSISIEMLRPSTSGEGRHLPDGTLVPFPMMTSSPICRVMVDDVYVDEAFAL